MLCPELVQAVRELLRDGIGQREIARRLPISRGSVNAIARGRRRNCQPRPTAQGPARVACAVPRCPDCGARIVETPCRACRLKAQLQKRPHPRHRGRDCPGQLRLDLRPAEAVRYRRVRRRKLRAEGVAEALLEESPF